MSSRASARSGVPKLLLPYGEVIQQLALAARKLILEEAPEASDFVYEVYTIADHFTFTQRPSDAFIFTTTHANWVNLGFNFGSMLPDPDGLLHGRVSGFVTSASRTRPIWTRLVFESC